MWERYRFLRYYLPGFLFFVYLALLIIPQLSPASDITDLSLQGVVSIFGGIIVASPVIGFIIYVPFNYMYEWHYAKKNRLAIDWLKKCDFFEKEEDKEYYSKKITDLNFTKKKELLDIIYHLKLETKESDSKKHVVGIDLKVLDTLANTLNNFSSRMVCALFASFFSFVAFAGLLLLDRTLFALFRVEFQLNPCLFMLSFLIVCGASALLYSDTKRVLREAYQLEEYIVQVKVEEIKLLLERLFPRDGEQRKPEVKKEK